MKRSLLQFLLSFSLIQISFGQDRLQSPSEFLGYDLGKHFTRHHKIVEYYYHVADVMPNVKIHQYGMTNERRPLIIATISSQENIDNWEQIKTDNLKRTGMLPGTPSGNKIAIVWLSYNVHGNESSSSEATMQTLYELANPNDSEKQEWLKNTVVIMDPCINPDGRDRYANFNNQYANKIPNPNLDSKEHREPWPGGRANHYLFDLNRDWAWLTQVESRNRIKLYQEIMPHVHVDFHEQGLNNPYYYAPAAEPYHEVITNWQREFQTMIGKNHAKYFDKEGWLYFTREIFDLLYPSYGDTYPTYNGAIGMTYEKGGGGRAGLAGLMENQDTVKLIDRIMHHHTTGLSTVEITSRTADRVVDEFTSYFNNSQNQPAGRYKSYVVKGNNHPDKIARLKKWMDQHSITYSGGKSSKSHKGYAYRSGREETFNVNSTDIVVSMYQPKSNFIKAMFEPNTRLSDSVTYDITAWGIPYVYDLIAYASTDRIPTGTLASSPDFSSYTLNGKPYAYLSKYESLRDLKFLSKILREGVKVRSAEKTFTLDGNSYRSGTLVVLRWDNENLGDFDEIIKKVSDEMKQPIVPAYTGFVDKGKDFGSRFVNFLQTPEVAVLAGNQVSSLSFGEIWHFFEQQLDYPLTVLDTDRFSNYDLSKYDVLIVPNGSYRLFTEDRLKDINHWVKDGGRLILIGNALNSFVDIEGFGLKNYASDEEKEKAEEEEKKLKEESVLNRYEDRQREQIPNSISGAIYNVTLDNSHPLAFGYRGEYFSLKRSSSRYAYLEEGWNVGVIKNASDRVSGFVGSNVKNTMAKTLVFGIENIGSGEVIYMVDNPLFRAFWYNGKLMVGNAIFMAGQ